MSHTRKINRKELSTLSRAEMLQLSRETYRKLYDYMKPYRGRFIAGVVLGVVAGLFNSVMLLGFQVIFAIVLPQGEGQTKATKLPFIGEFDPLKWLGLGGDAHAGLTTVVVACAMIPLLIGIRGFLGYLGNYFMMWVGNKMLHRLRNDVFRSLMNQSLGFYHRSKIGDLIQTVFNQTRAAQTNAVQLSQVLIKNPVTILALFGTLLWKQPVFTLCSIVIFPLCIGPVIYVSRRVRKAGAREEEEAGALMVTMHEAFTGVRVVKAHAREDYEVRRFDRANSSMLDMVMRWGKALEIVGPLVETVASFGIAAGLIYAWHMKMQAHDFFLIVMALTQIYPPAKELSRVQILLSKCITATSSVFALMEQEPDVKDAPDAKAIGRAHGAVSLNKVTFHYRDAKQKKNKKPALHEVSLNLEPGRFYALVGPSGAGKSTLFALLLRFYDPDAGWISLDGMDLRRMTQQSLRNNIGTVNQDTFLFHDTIRENIRYGRLDASEEEIIAAARQAHADDFIVHQKEQYNTMVGDAGNNLSGGQKQRISIARAILRGAPILLLDEATSALDTESEKIIQEAIHTLSKGKTVVAIAHRLSTILEADQIVVMDHGRVLDVGTHGELLSRCELYQRLYQLQFKGGEVDPDAPVEDISLDAAA